MRCDQFEGLPKDAISFLAKWRKKCHCCGQFLPSTTVCGHYVGMFEMEYPLIEYHLKDGRIAREFEQTSIWSSGPIFFLGLKISNGQIFQWTEGEINERTQ